MQEAIFRLDTNAFWILKAHYASNQAGILDLADDAEFNENHKLEIVQRSRQALLTPMARLEQEVSWLPELSSAQADEIMSLLESSRPDELLTAAAFLPDLAKANILAHLCGEVVIDETIPERLLDSWEEFDTRGLLTFLNEQRAIAGFPGIDKNQLEAAIKEICVTHARSAAMAVWKSKKPGLLMEGLVEANMNKAQASQFLSRFVREYDNLSEPRLTQIDNAIDQQVDIARQGTSELEAIMREIADLLLQWDEVNQPVQVYEQRLGHEEGRSKKIYEKLRSLSLELANERGEFRYAKQLSEALLHTFPELVSVAKELKDDVEILKKNEQHKVVEPLVAACEAAKSQLPKLKSALQGSGFAKARRGIVKDIFEAFDTAAKARGTADAAFRVVRNLAIFVYNDRNDPETAFRLIHGLITYHDVKPSQDMSGKLYEERSVLHQNWKMGELEDNKGNKHAMDQLIDEMIIYATPDAKAKLLDLKNRIHRGHNQEFAGRIVGWFGGWAIQIAVAIIIYLLFSSFS